jgi:hypothetical protein
VDERAPGSPEPAAGRSLAGRLALALRLPRDPQSWAKVRQAADVLCVVAPVAITVGTFAGSPRPDVTGVRLWLTTVAVLCAARAALGLAERRAPAPETGEDSPALAASPAPDPPRRRDPAPRPALTLIECGESPESASTHWFCGYCGVSGSAHPPLPTARVCGRCGAGLLLEAPADAAPGREEPFLVVDGRLTVQAVSKRAEALLGVTETEVTDHPITELITDADAETDQHASFVVALAEVADIDGGCRSAFVRPRDQFGIRIRARIGHCGPPRAALIVLETPAPGSGPRLRLVPAERPQAARHSL